MLKRQGYVKNFCVKWVKFLLKNSTYHWVSEKKWTCSDILDKNLPNQMLVILSAPARWVAYNGAQLEWSNNALKSIIKFTSLIEQFSRIAIIWDLYMIDI